MPNFVPMIKTSGPVTREQLLNILKKLDTDDDGRLSWKEVAAALKQHGLHFHNLKALYAVLKVDHDADGHVDLDEMQNFVSLVLQKWGISLV